MKTTIRVVWLLAIHALPGAAPAATVCDSIDSSGIADFEQIVVRQYTTRSYPSLRPIVWLGATFSSLKTPTDVYEPNWWLEPSNWTVMVNEKRTTAFNLSFDKNQFTAFFDIVGARKGDKIIVRAAVPKKRPDLVDFKPVCAVSSTKDVPPKETQVTLNLDSLYTASIEPGWAPKQDLIDGKKRDVGQLAIKLDFKSIAPNQNKVRVYLKGDELISSDRKDASSKLEGILGAERSLTNGWYIPWKIVDGRILTNQRGDNASFIVSSGLRTIFPWGWSKWLLNNDLIKAPLSPEIEFSVQHETRLKQDVESKKKFKDKKTLRLHGEFSWTPIHIATGRGFSKEDVSVEFTAKGWFLPNQRNSVDVRINRLEGLVEASLLVPIRKFVPEGGLAPDPSAEAAKQRIRLKYSRGSNEANGFKHFQQLALGYELIK